MAEGVLSSMPYNPTPTLPQVLPSISPEMSAGQTPTGLSPFMPMPTTYPTFSDIFSRYEGADPHFNKAIELSTPSNAIDPSLQGVLDRIGANTADAARRGTARAQALAVRRGLPGSSIEQFGVASAAGEAEKAGRDAEAQVLVQDAIRRFQLKDLQSRALFDRSTQGLGLMENELASQRNLGAFLSQLGLEQSLGQQGIDIARANIGLSRDIARDEQQGMLYSAGIQALLPALFGGGGGFSGGGGGFLSNLFGGGGGGGGGTLTGAGTGQYVPGIGQVGTGVAAGGPSFLAGGLLPNLGAGLLGNFAGTAAFGQGKHQMIGSGIGGVAGSFFGPLGAGLGSFLGAGAGKLYGQANDTVKSVFAPFLDPGKTVKTIGSGVEKVGKSVSKAVKKVFPF